MTANQPGLFDQPSSKMAPDRGQEPGVPRFRRRDPLLCGWCYGPFERKPRGGHGIYCRDGCRAEANRADKKERQRRHEEARRRMGMATAVENGREQCRLARREALLCMAAKGAIIISDLREWCHARGVELDWEKPWTGSLFHLSPWFEYTGRRRAAHHGASNARKVNEYRLSALGRAELAKLSSCESR